MQKIKYLFFFTLVSFGLFACNSDYIIKPRGYFNIPLPQKNYKRFQEPGYPYSFEYPVYGTVSRDTSFFEAQPESPYWINIDFPELGGRIHISYKDVQQSTFDSLVNDAYTLAYKQHTNVATAIKPEPFTTATGVEGVYFNLKGNTATANQFFVTDTAKHFLRGALYFDATPNEDSLRPVNEFLKKDLEHLINTIQWKTGN
jgi:gliding motility-associated lipoprotein GldD